MRAVDPRADMDVELQVGPVYVPGEPPPTDGYKSLGKERRFSLKWITRKHRALGSYLHAPTIDKLENGEAPTAEKIIKTATEALKECEEILSSRLIRLNMGIFFSCACMYCKSQMKGRLQDWTDKRRLELSGRNRP